MAGAPEDEEFLEKDKWNVRSIIVNGFLFALKLVVGIFTMSMAILSDSIDSGIDVATSAMARYSVKIAHMPADERHHYGHGKYENLSGLIQAIVIVIIAFFLIIEAARRMLIGPELESLEWGILIMIISVIGKFGISRNMLRVARKHESIAMEANALNLQADIWMSLGVLCSLAVIWLFKEDYLEIVHLDPLVAMVIAVLIMKAGVNIARRSSKDLLDEQISTEEQAVINGILDGYRKDFLEFHRFRARKSGNERHIDMHLVVPRERTIEDAHGLADKIEKEIKSKIRNATVVIHLEPCAGECAECKRKGIDN